MSGSRIVKGAAVAGVAVAALVGCAALAGGPQEQVTPGSPVVTAPPARQQEPPSEGERALESAQRYVDTMPFSRKGLATQLGFEGYGADAVAYATDRVDADWDAEAVEAATSYMDTMPMSNEALRDQLTFDGFTREQAVRAVEAVTN